MCVCVLCIQCMIEINAGAKNSCCECACHSVLLLFSLPLCYLLSASLSLSALLVLCDIQHTNPCSDTRAGCGPALPLGKRLNIREGHKEAGLERSKEKPNQR